jgi:hypothetical protein
VATSPPTRILPSSSPKYAPDFALYSNSAFERDAHGFHLIALDRPDVLLPGDLRRSAVQY